MNNVKFAIMGEKGVGKSYIANIIEKEFYNSWQLAFADDLKSMTEMVFDWIPTEYDDPKYKEIVIPNSLNVNRLSYREIIIEYAAILNRIEPGIFIRKLEKNINYIQDTNPELKIFITDVRTQAETKWCQYNNIPIIKVIGDSQFNSNQGILFENFVKDYETDLVFFNKKHTNNKKEIVDFFHEFLD